MRRLGHQQFSSARPPSPAVGPILRRWRWVIASALSGLLVLSVAMVAQAASGDIYVADPSASAVIRIDPTTGAQTTVASAPDVADPLGITVDATGDLIVLDTAPPKRILRIDPSSGAVTTVTSDTLFSGPNDLAVEASGKIVVADGSTGYPPDNGGILRVDPVTGAQTAVSLGGSFGCPDGIAIEASGGILASTTSACAGAGKAIVRVDPVTGSQSVVSSGGIFVEPQRLAVEADGKILLTDGGAGQAIRRVHPVTGTQSTVSSGGLFTASGFGIAGIALEANGDILVAHIAANAVFRVDPVTGAQSVVSAGGSLVDPIGIAFVPDTTPPDPPALTDTDPDSPANDNSPKVKGSAEAGSTVRLHTTSDCTDAEAATGSAEDFASPGLVVSVADDSTTSFYATATDAAGNTSDCSTSSIAYQEDSTPPGIVITTPADGASYTLGSAVPADYECQDPGGSGVSSCNGTVADGSPIDTATAGAKTFTVTAEDNAGNDAALTHEYTVVYDFAGFFQPVDNLPTLNAAKAGSAIPVKFSLSGFQGLAIFSPGYPKSEQIMCSSTAAVDGIESTVTAGSSGLTYDSLTDQYHYVWKTSKSWANSCRQLVVKLDDTTSHQANFKLK
jgi:streptogramin lyase